MLLSRWNVFEIAPIYTLLIWLCKYNKEKRDWVESKPLPWACFGGVHNICKERMRKRDMGKPVIHRLGI